MGTRHITRVIYKEEVIIDQYGQWDGYPTGQGMNVMQFVKEYCADKKLQEFKERLEKSCLLMAVGGRYCFTGAPITDSLNKVEKLRHKNRYSSDWWKDPDVGCTKRELREYMAASRDTGSDILYYLMEREKDGMQFYTDEYTHKMTKELDWQIEGMFIVDLDNELVTIDWHGSTREYSFSRVQQMENKQIEKEMEEFEKEE